jgi:hypothetical protein
MTSRRSSGSSGAASYPVDPSESVDGIITAAEPHKKTLHEDAVEPFEDPALPEDTESPGEQGSPGKPSGAEFAADERPVGINSKVSTDFSGGLV